MKREIEDHLRKVLDYVLEMEANHFNAWCGDGNDPDCHIYKSAYIVHKYIDEAKPRPTKN